MYPKKGFQQSLTALRIPNYGTVTRQNSIGAECRVDLISSPIIFQSRFCGYSEPEVFPTAE